MPIAAAPVPASPLMAADEKESRAIETEAVSSPLTAAAIADAPAATLAEPVDDAERYRDVVSDQGQRAHGLYFTELTVARIGAKGIVHSVRGAGLDAAVIDIKDQDGRVSYDTHVEVLAPERHVLVHDMPALLRELKSAGVYTIARIACFSDETLPRKRPDLSVMDSRPSRAGEIWNARRNNSWLDPSNPINQDMVVAIASEAESLGFDEVQLDYIRFPVDAGTVNARFPSQGDRTRSEILLGLLRRVDEALHIPLGVDVFGVAAIRRGDPEGLGQSLDEWAKYVEVFSPMLYVNGMKTWMRSKTEGRAGLLVEMSVHTLRQRVGAGPVIRPFLQAFERGADYFNSEFIAEQIRGARSGGGDGFLFWNPGSSYSMVRTAMAESERGPVPFAIEDRRVVRMQLWSQRQSAELSAR